MRQHSGEPEPKWNRQITRCIFPPDSEKSSGNKTRVKSRLEEAAQQSKYSKKCSKGSRSNFMLCTALALFSALPHHTTLAFL